MTTSWSVRRFVICHKTCRPQLIGVLQVLGIAQSIAVLRGVHNGLGKKEDILSNAQVVNVEKVRSSFGQKSPTLIRRHRHNMHPIYFTWHRSVLPRYRYFFSSHGCPYRGSTNASHTPLSVLWASGRL